MRIYSKIVFNMTTGKTIEAESFEYDGPVAELKGGEVKYPSPYYSVASGIVGKLKGPLSSELRKDILTNPFQDYGSQQYQQAVGDIRGGYGARGLEGSGIAVKGEQDALQKIVSQVEAQRAGQLIGLLGTASNPPSFPSGTPQQGSGFMGLK